MFLWAPGVFNLHQGDVNINIVENYTKYSKSLGHLKYLKK